jgi:ligand-binding sensor domain-containing protein/DNA-binding CsgD family transcriptional regulator
MKHLTLFLFIFTISIITKAQVGLPQINNYSSSFYKAGTQNWKIEQDRNGVMYFANNEGLLSYDGRYWKLYPLPHKTIVRSVKIHPDGKIYVGGQDEIGYFFPDEHGVLKFHSLRELIPIADKQFADIWNIEIFNQEVYFRTRPKIFHYKDGAFRVYKAEGAFEFVGKVKDQILAHENTKGILSVKNGVWKTVCDHPDLKSAVVTAILPYQNDTLLITTLKNGLYLLHQNQLSKLTSKDDASFFKHRISCALQVNKDWYAFTTSSAGCFIVDKKGNIIQRFTVSDGLQRNNIRSIFKDKSQNLWLGLDDGIDFITFNTAVKYIYPDPLKQTTGYATRILDNQLYIGTSNGLYASPLNPNLKDISYNSNNFSIIPKVQGQVWNLNVLNNQLLVAHEEGTFLVKNNIANQLYNAPGTWIFEPTSPYYPAKEIIAGTFNGLQHIAYNQGKFINKCTIKGIDESLRFLLYDNSSNTFWASHPYRGIYRFKLSDDKTSIIKTWIYKEKDGLPSHLHNYVARIKNRIVVATLKGIYEFDEAKQKFSPSKFFSPILKKTFQYLNEDQDGNIWFVSYKNVGVIDFQRKEKGKNYSIVYFPELTSKVLAGFENIYIHNKENIFISSNTGVIHINYPKYLANIRPLNVLLTQVKISGKTDSTIFGGYFLNQNKIAETQDKTQKPKLAYKHNSLHFEYSSTLYEQQNNIEYSYQLQGFDKEWSVWSAKSEKDYTNIPHGDYTFKVKVRNNLGNESPVTEFSFTVEPAWYQTNLFYFFCFLLLAFAIYLLIQRQKKIHQKEQEYLKKTHQLEIEHNEKEIVKLQNEKLEADVNFKNKELATATMHLVQRGKLLAKIKEELLPIVKVEDAENAPEEFKRILSLLNEAERNDSDWEQFAIHFDHVHSNFLTKLKEKFPSLSQNDLKLCAYLKMNLSSKEMAQLMSITIRAVEVSRYRLRKKLNVSSDTNLFDYLMEAANSE